MTEIDTKKISTSEKIYADSLIGIGKDGIMSYEDIFNDLKTVKQAVSESEDFAKVMENPSISDSTKDEIVDEIFTGKINNRILNFLKILISKKRFKELNLIIQAYSNELDKINNTQRIEVISAVELTDEQKQKLTKKLEIKLHKNIVASWILNKDIIGGLVIKIDDNIIDNSLKHKLESLSKNII